MTFTLKTKFSLIILWLLSLFCISFCSHTDSIYSFSFPNRTIRFSANGDLLDINTTYSLKNVSRASQIFSNSNSIAVLRLRALNNPFLDSCIQSSQTVLQKSQTDSTETLHFLSSPFSNIRYEKTYTIVKSDYTIRYKVDFFEVTPGSGLGFKDSSMQLQLSLSKDLQNEFKPVHVGKKFKKIRLEKTESFDISSIDGFGGFQNRFWSLCLKPEHFSPISYRYESFTVNLSPDISKPSHFTIYSGPVVYQELKKTDPTLTKLLYPLPFWMRWISLGFLLIFDTLLKISRNVTLSVVLLSICVKIVLAPLFKIADSWQKKVNQQSSLLQPRLCEIKKKYKGEEQTKQTLAAYKELGISPVYTLKSLLSAAIQIPVFFAAYHMLSEHIALSNISFLWISDLSSPDHLLKLPITLPLFGSYLNILPIMMTSFTFASSWLHSDSSLSYELQKRQRINLYWMAALFFLMLYTSPAGMVIYWTMNNILAFFSTVFEKIIRPKGTDSISMDKT